MLGKTLHIKENKLNLSKLSVLVLTALFITGCEISNSLKPHSDNANMLIKDSEVNQSKTNYSFSSIKLSNEDIAKLDKEYMSFSTKALSTEYFKKKLTQLIGSDNGVNNSSKIVKELKYAQYKSESVIPFKAMSFVNPSFYNILTGVASVISQRSIDNPFDIFIASGNPISAPVATSATQLNTTEFTANWNTVSSATSGYVLTVKQGTNIISTLNISNQSTTSQLITGLSSNNNYTYTIKANTSSGLSAESNIISVMTLSNVTTFAGSGAFAAGSGYLDGNGTSSQFNNPIGIASDSAGNIYVADFSNSKIRKIANDTNHTVSTIAGSEGAGSGQGYQDGDGTSAKFFGPNGVAVDSSGNVYVADSNNHKIRKISNNANHTVSTIAGSTQGYQDGDGTSAKFNTPNSITVDSLGNVYVADYLNNKIRKIANDANHTVTTIAGTGGFSGGNGYQDGAGSLSMFSRPTSIVSDSIGNMYIADSGNHKIRKITNDASYTVSTVSGTINGYQDGAGNSAQFSYPTGVAIDSSGNIYVADQNNHKIRKIINDTNHTVFTIAGFGGYSSGGGYVDGLGNVAKFLYPNGITVDSAGKVYVGDSNNNKIRKIE